MRTLENYEINTVAGGMHYSEILDKGALYGGSVGMICGGAIGFTYVVSSPLIGLVVGAPVGLYVGVLTGIVGAWPIATVFGTTSYSDQ